MGAELRAPFPWFGGKSRVASLVWERFGDVPNYVEPFAGSLAVLLGRPHEPRVETINDLDCYLANFWRALQAEPDEVAHWADWPVNEADLHARHLWLIHQDGFRERMHAEPDFYDVKIAGWWVWGICQWIGSGWCVANWQKLPHLGDAGRGVHRPSQQRPHLRDAGRGDLYEYMWALAQRLRKVRVCCGDWSRVLGPSPTYKLGLTGIFLDPPYSDDAGRADGLYARDDTEVAHAAREWALENGGNPELRIALCGYEDEHAREMPEDWDCVAWKAPGGYSSQSSNGNDNPHKERIWFSPYCLKPVTWRQRTLFGVSALAQAG